MSKLTRIAVAALILVISIFWVSCSDQSAPSGQAAAAQRASANAGAVSAAAAQAAAGSQTACRGLAALERAADAKKYLFAFLYKDPDDQTRTMREVFRGAMARVSDRALSVEIDASQASEKPFIERFGAGRAPTPLVLAIAPNGAVTKGLPTTFTEEQLLDAFASPGMESCLGALQDGKIVFVCVQNAMTKHNQEAMAGVREFKMLPRYATLTEIVEVDPNDPSESALLQAFKIDAAIDEALTVLLSPPGTAVARFSGATDKAALEKALLAAASSCKPGSGCCPK